MSPKEIHNNIVNPPEGIGYANKTAVITMRQKLSGIIRNKYNFSLQLQSFDGSFHLLNKSEVSKLEFLPDPIMPKDYGTTLSSSEIDDLVSYLVTVARASQSGTKRNPENETE